MTSDSDDPEIAADAAETVRPVRRFSRPAVRIGWKRQRLWWPAFQNPLFRATDRAWPAGGSKLPCGKCSQLILPDTANRTGGLCMHCWEAWFNAKHDTGQSHDVPFRVIEIDLAVIGLLESCEHYCIFTCCGFNAVELTEERIAWHMITLSAAELTALRAEIRQIVSALEASPSPLVSLGDDFTVEAFRTMMQPVFDLLDHVPTMEEPTASDFLSKWINIHHFSFKGTLLRLGGSEEHGATYFAEFESSTHFISFRAWDHAFCLDLMALNKETGRDDYMVAGECDGVTGMKTRLEAFLLWLRDIEAGRKT